MIIDYKCGQNVQALEKTAALPAENIILNTGTKTTLANGGISNKFIKNILISIELTL